jgi:peptide/nickel transport system permease protein
MSGRLNTFVDALLHLILPAIALGSIPLAIITRITRAAVLDVSNEDYVRTARAKGLAERRVDNRHVMRNAWLPVVTVIGLQVGGLLAGAVITETVFSWNGVGSYIVNAIQDHDYLVVQSTILIFALIFLIVNLTVDVAYAFLNPRIRYG